MKASQFPRMYRAYDLDKKKMFNVKELIEAGFTVAPDGLPSNATKPMFDVVLMWFSGMVDDKKQYLFESDICKVEVLNEFGSVTVDYGIVKWEATTRQFILAVPSKVRGIELNIVSNNLIGNEFDNPELVPLVHNEITEVPELNG